MRTLHFLIVFLLCVHHSLSEPFITECFSTAVSQADMDKHTSLFNDRRSTTAAMYQIANMHEVKYDLDLEKVLQTFTSCEENIKGVNFRVYRYVDDEPFKMWLKAQDPQNLTKEEIRVRRSSIETPTYPLMTRWASCTLSKKCNYKRTAEDLKIFGVDAIPERSVIAFGPISEIQMSDFKIGTSGTQCPNGKSSIFNNLCKAPSDSKHVYKKIESENKKPGKDSEAARDGGSEAEGSAENSRVVLTYSLVIFLLNYSMVSLV